MGDAGADGWPEEGGVDPVDGVPGAVGVGEPVVRRGVGDGLRARVGVG